MKKILIIGKDTYIGRHLKKHLMQYGNNLAINPISSNTETWKILNLKVYDCVIYLAEPESDCYEEDYEKQSVYYNCDLVEDVANEAKRCGVKRFIYISTIEVYGKTSEIGEDSIIDRTTELNPATVFSYTKLEGERRLKEIEDKFFKTVILRIPFLYGPGCQGIYSMLTDILLSTNKVPMINNKLSVLNIETLCSYIKYMIEHDYYGTFHPQNKSYMSTTDLFKLISKELLIPLKISKFLGWRYNKFKGSCPDIYSRIMGSLVYSKDIDG